MLYQSSSAPDDKGNEMTKTVYQDGNEFAVRHAKIPLHFMYSFKMYISGLKIANKATVSFKDFTIMVKQ